MKSLREHAYKIVFDNLKDFATYELETLAFKIEVEIRERVFNSNPLKFDYDLNSDISFTYKPIPDDDSDKTE